MSEKKASQVLAGVRAGITRTYNRAQREIHGSNWKPDPHFKPWQIDEAVQKVVALREAVKGRKPDKPKKDVDLKPLGERKPNIREIGAKYKGKQVIRTKEEILDSARKNNGVSIEVIDLQLNALKDTEAFVFYTDGPTKITYSQKYKKLLISPHHIQLKEKK